MICEYLIEQFITINNDAKTNKIITNNMIEDRDEGVMVWSVGEYRHATIRYQEKPILLTKHLFG